MNLNQQDVAILSRALSSGLISIDQYTSLLRELAEGEVTSVASLLASRAGISAAQISSLVERTDSDRANETRFDSAAKPPVIMPPDGATLDDDSTPASADELMIRAMRREAQQRYQIVHEVGRGGLGRVLRARDEFVGRDVALKEMILRSSMSLERIERFFLEAQLTGRLDHPGIAPVYALGVTPDGHPFYTMKFVEGRTLGSLIKRYHDTHPDDPKRQQRLHELLSALVDASNAVAFANHRGIIHRDLKPLNIMVGEYGETYVVDWGMAKVFRSDPSNAEPASGADELKASTLAANDDPVPQSGSRNETAEGTVMGTLAYMSPEQARGEVTALDGRTDIYSLGASLYEILTGRAPYSGGRKEVLSKVRQGQFTPPRQRDRRIPSPLEAICLKAMAFEPDHRYATAKQLADDLVLWQAGAPVSVYQEPPWQLALRWLRRHKTSVAAAMVALLAIGLATGLWGFQQRQRRAAIETQTRDLLRKGQAAFNEQRFDQAQQALQQAAGLVSTEKKLGWLQTDVQRWLADTKKRLTFLSDRRQADANFVRFRELADDALVHSLLANSLHGDDDVRRAQDSIRGALAIFDLRPDTPATPKIPTDLYSAPQVAEILATAKNLYWAYADTLVASERGAAEPQQRAAARSSLGILAGVSSDETPDKALLLRQADLLFQTGEEAAARDKIAAAEKSVPRTAEDFFLLGDFYYRYENYTAAAASFESALQLDPENFWSQYYLGACQLRLGSYRQAIAHLSAAASRRPDFVYIYLLRGLAYGQLGELKAAESDFERVAEREPQLYGLYLNRGVVRLRHGQQEAAVRDFNKAVSLSPASAAAQINLAEAYRLAGALGDARATAERAVEAAPKDPRAFQMRAAIFMAQQDQAAASKDLEEAVRLTRPKTLLRAHLLTMRAQTLRATGDIDGALASLNQAIDERPDEFQAMRAKANILVAKGQDREAIEWATRFLQYSPLVPAAFAAQAREANRGGSTASVSERLNPVAVQLSARRIVAGVYRDRGVAQMRLGDTEAGVADLVTAFRLAADHGKIAGDTGKDGESNQSGAGEGDADFSLAHARLGWAMLLRSQDLALKQFEAAVALTPDSTDALTGLAFVEAARGNHREAAQRAQQALELGSKDAGLYFNLACVFSQAYQAVHRGEPAVDREKLAASYLASAVNALQQCFAKQPERQGFYLRQAREDTSLDPIRASDAFQKLVGTPDEPEEAQQPVESD